MLFEPTTFYPGAFIKITGILCLAGLFTCISCHHPEQEPTDHPAHADSILTQTRGLLNNGQVWHSITYIDSAYQFFPDPGPGDLWKRYNFKADYYAHYEPDLVKARSYVDSAFAVLNGKTAIYKESYAWTIFLDGDVLMAEKRYSKAFQRYYEGRQFAQKNLDSCQFGQFTNSLGLIRYNQGQYLKAIPYLQQSLEEMSHCRTDFYTILVVPQATFNDIALCYEKAGRLDSAIHYYRQALAFLDRHAAAFPNPDNQSFFAAARGVIYGNLGGVYSKLNQEQLAERYLEESIRINDRPGYEMADALTAEIKLANLYIHFARYPEAAGMLQHIKMDLEQQEQLHHQSVEQYRIQWYQLSWVYADSTRQPLQAYQFARQYYSMRDSMAAVSQDLKNADMDAAFKISDQQYRLSLLDKENETKKRSLYAIIIFSAMACCILFLVWRNLKRSRKNVVELWRLNWQVSKQNERISEQNTQMKKALSALEQSQADNTRMMKIAAHDLRNPISGITTLAGMMLDEPGRTEYDQTRLELIRTSGNNSLELVGELLQIHTQANELTKESVNLDQMLHYCVDLLQHKAEAKKQQIDLQSKPMFLTANREKLWRVISNLVANAIKFSPSGATIAVKSEERSSGILIAVEDHGIGIPAEMQDKQANNLLDWDYPFPDRS
ncbi:hypothetical protein F5148DRAFT_1295869 [Russula earlei]|uniref:Uncharacterized protein n=1 Tax=Russula earlei TaxID=71964 RepID=A0ACC0TRU2_9AGAM|nr:hypothetical protein F5148DRAFT_1295869 [Russula earlei]